MRSRPTHICCSGVAAQAQQVAAAGETQAASEYQTEANLYGESEIGDWISGAISGVAGVAERAGSAGLGPLAPVATAAVAAAQLIGTRLTTSIKLVEICSVPFVTTANAATE
jgi:hypothetical protein